MKILIALGILMSTVVLAAELPTEPDCKTAVLQEQTGRGMVLQELGRVIQENAGLKQKIDQLTAELEKLKPKPDKK